MQRRDLKRGSQDARDRARHRHRRRATDSDEDPHQALSTYLQKASRETLRDHRQVARDTSTIALSLGERYRQLAIALELHHDVRDWPTLSPIYDAALRADPKLAATWSSWALAHLATLPETVEVLAAAEVAARRAVELAPTQGHAHTVLGYVLYQSGGLEEAIPTLERALALGETGWAHLWLAHTLHDLRAWSAAADAYARIPADAFPRHATWRVQLARQQQAACLLRAGRNRDACSVYDKVLRRFERALDAALDSTNSPVLALGPPTLLLEDAPRLPGLATRIAHLRHRLQAHPDPLLHLTPADTA